MIPRRDPRRRVPVPVLPPAARSRAGLGLTVQAGNGRFALQRCADCGALAWPPRDACARCLSVDLAWRDTEPSGVLLAETVTRTSTNTYFAARLPLRVGTIAMTAGPSVIAHLHGAVRVGDSVRLALKLDAAGQSVMIALPGQETPDMMDDPVLQALICDPKDRRVLITDGGAPVAPALARALRQAGARAVMVGEAERWLPRPDAPDWAAMGVETLPLDVTDAASVARAAASHGAKVDILVNTAQHLRPGGLLGQGTGPARDAMEINVLGLIRLAQAFGPAMAARGQDGDHRAVAWVNLLSVYALSAAPEYAAFTASQAAARAIAQTLRAELRSGGVRVLDVLHGPVDDEWQAELPAPRLATAALAKTVVAGLQQGVTRIAAGDVAQDILVRWLADADLLERELSEGTMT